MSGQGGPGGLEALAARLEALEAERGVLDTLYRYGQTIDYGLEDGWVDCFTEDATYDVRFGEQTGMVERSGRYVGHAAIRAFVEAHSRAPAVWHKHFLVEPRIEVDGERATVASYFTRIDSLADATPYLRAFGRYLDHLVRSADGRWRFTERIAEVEAVHVPS